MITLHAAGELGSEEVACSVETGRALVKAGLHPASGGDGTLACSDADGADLDAIIKATERYCVVFQTLNRAPNLSVSYSTS